MFLILGLAWFLVALYIFIYSFGFCYCYCYCYCFVGLGMNLFRLTVCSWKVHLRLLLGVVRVMLALLLRCICIWGMLGHLGLRNFFNRVPCFYHYMYFLRSIVVDLWIHHYHNGTVLFLVISLTNSYHQLQVYMYQHNNIITDHYLNYETNNAYVDVHTEDVDFIYYYVYLYW